MDSKSSFEKEHDMFTEFCGNPRDSGIVCIQGCHRYISLAIQGEIPTPKKAILIALFKEFTSEPIKDYVFNRIPKKMLLELALCVLQDIISNGPERALSLRLKVAKTSEGVKTVVIGDDTGKDAEDQSSNSTSKGKIANATFQLSDKQGKDPPVSISIDSNSTKPAYQPPDKRGYFTPSRTARKSLNKAFDNSESNHAKAVS